MTSAAQIEPDNNVKQARGKNDSETVFLCPQKAARIEKSICN
jgi:hypothetical protein